MRVHLARPSPQPHTQQRTSGPPAHVGSNTIATRGHARTHAPPPGRDTRRSAARTNSPLSLAGDRSVGTGSRGRCCCLRCHAVFIYCACSRFFVAVASSAADGADAASGATALERGRVGRPRAAGAFPARQRGAREPSVSARGAVRLPSAASAASFARLGQGVAVAGRSACPLTHIPPSRPTHSTLNNPPGAPDCAAPRRQLCTGGCHRPAAPTGRRPVAAVVADGEAPA
eukprot:358323-Chlamydomonas_euryale.AAC.2